MPQTTETTLRARLGAVTDPELPVPITDLGMVRAVHVDGDVAQVELVTTFLGCPARSFIERDVRALAGSVDGLRDLVVSWSSDHRWSIADITPAGRAALAEFGVAVPDADGVARCPHCSSPDIVIDSEFGASLCRRLGHCRACGDPVELMRAPLNRVAS